MSRIVQLVLKSGLWLSLLFLISHPIYCQHHNVTDFEITPLDGWFNNLLHPDWGAIDGQLLRKSKVAYSDGTYQPSGRERPNPFAISKVGHHGRPGLGSLKNRTAFLVFFGQQVVEEILDAQRPGCPREFINVPVDARYAPAYDPENKGNVEMPFLRSRYDQRTGQTPNNPRQQLNEITPYIDGTLTYGPGKTWTDAIRELNEHGDLRGRLKAVDPNAPINQSFPSVNEIRLPFANPPPPREHELKPVGRFWTIGNPRGNENPFILTFQIMFFRYHNYLALEYAKQYPNLNDEQIFNLAKKKLVAVHQKIIMYDWLPKWINIDNTDPRLAIPEYNMSDPHNRYDPNIHPGIAQEFQSAAMRFGHTLVTPGTWIRNRSVSSCDDPNAFKRLDIKVPNHSGKVHAVRLCNAFWNGQEFLKSSPEAYEEMILGLSSTLSEREDHIIVPDLREHLFGPLEFSRRDLVALNIQRARDHGLPGYNDVRIAYGLAPKTSWESINTVMLTPDEVQQYDPDYNTTTNTSVLYPSGCYMCGPIQRVKALYGNTSSPEELDLFSGGILETTPDGPGELFATIVREQFLRIRHGDRFWFENKDNGLFTDAEIADIHNTTIVDIILAITDIKRSEIGDDPFIFNANSGLCAQPQQMAADTDNEENGTRVIEECTPLQHYDYFSGSEYSFALSFLALGLCIPGTIGVMVLMAKLRQRKILSAKRRGAPNKKADEPNTHLAVEWMGPKDGERNVKIKFDNERKKIHVTDRGGKKPLRMIDLRHIERVHIRVSTDRGLKIMSVRVPGEIDLVLQFIDMTYRGEFRAALETFLQSLGIKIEPHDMQEAMILKDATTKEKRKQLLDKFFRVVCLQAFSKSTADINSFNLSNMDADTANSISGIQLTRTEFADALGLKPTSLFVRNMFLLVDKDRNGLVSFTEFMEMFMVLAKGGAQEKAQMMFNMYDLKSKGHLTADEFSKMIKSLLDLSDTSLDASDLDALVDTLYQKVGLRAGDKITMDKFAKIFTDDYEKTLANATLQLPGQQAQRHSLEQSFRDRRKTFIDSFGGDDLPTGSLQRSKSRVRIQTKQKMEPVTGWQKHLYTFSKYVENYKRQIFWLALYTLVTIGIFVERAYYYSFEREHVGLRRLAGYGVTVTRGAASGMMWTYSCLLMTMSRNVITFLRETFLHRFIPFDSAHDFHKYIAAWALVFTVMHCVGHGINLYHISTWASNDLNCVFREYFRATDTLASFHYWAWTTITGLTGIILTVIVIIMYVFAIPYARRNLFSAFWFTHSMYILLYIFMIMHGSGRLVQAPLTQNFLIGPLVVFVIDKLISFSRRKVELSVKKAELLPSDVLGLTFKRPLNFEYHSGQWIRIACTELSSSEYHPFTLTSAPHEENLSLHIRAVGPWTTNVRKTYDANNRDGKPFPKVFIDGPFGEGHQDWYRYKVAVLVGGGIGVTPFASILKDIVYKSRSAAVRFPCEKVYFLWVTRTQKQFEWLTDIIREVEENDQCNLVDVHIFITQFQQKFDLRTTMLYICERHFQKVCGKSLFTGLRAKTHFGRPQFVEFFKSLHSEHPKANNVGVFSCGPPPMTLNVDRACKDMNSYENFPTFSHHYENF